MGIFDKILGGNTLYYPGCLTKFVAKDLKENYEKILRSLGIDFIELSEIEVCCGSPVLKAGYADDFKNLAEKNLKIFKEHSVKKIITNCPACFLVFKKTYQEFLKEKWDIQVEHISQTIHSEIKNQKPKIIIQNHEIKKITYHDPCHLGRQMGVYEEPREVIQSLGYEIVEMELNRLDSFCCGAGGGIQTNEPKLADKIAKDRISQAKKTETKTLITACPLCYLHLQKNAQDELLVQELSQLFKNND